jgi:hypothetical protein
MTMFQTFIISISILSIIMVFSIYANDTIKSTVYLIFNTISLILIIYYLISFGVDILSIASLLIIINKLLLSFRWLNEIILQNKPANTYYLKKSR